MYKYTINLTAKFKYDAKDHSVVVEVTLPQEFGGSKEEIFKEVYNYISNDLLISDKGVLIVLSDMYHIVINSLTVESVWN